MLDEELNEPNTSAGAASSFTICPVQSNLLQSSECIIWKSAEIHALNFKLN